MEHISRSISLTTIFQHFLHRRSGTSAGVHIDSAETQPYEATLAAETWDQHYPAEVVDITRKPQM